MHFGGAELAVEEFLPLHVAGVGGGEGGDSTIIRREGSSRLASSGVLPQVVGAGAGAVAMMSATHSSPGILPGPVTASSFCRSLHSGTFSVVRGRRASEPLKYSPIQLAAVALAEARSGASSLRRGAGR